MFSRHYYYYHCKWAGIAVYNQRWEFKDVIFLAILIFFYFLFWLIYDVNIHIYSEDNNSVIICALCVKLYKANFWNLIRYWTTMTCAIMKNSSRWYEWISRWQYRFFFSNDSSPVNNWNNTNCSIFIFLHFRNSGSPIMSTSFCNFKAF